MKKFFFFATALFAAISFSACSDDDDNDGGGSSAINYVSEVVYQDRDGKITTHKLEYDDQNRLTKITEKRDNGEARVFYPNQDHDWVFNEKGYLIYDGEFIYEYDDEDYLIERRLHPGSWTGSNIWKNGDCIHWEGIGYIDEFAYCERIANLNFEIWQLFGLDNNWHYAFTGRKSKHLLQKSDEDEGDYISLYEYEFDEKGRPVTIYRTTTIHDYYGDKDRETVTIKYK